MLIYQILLALTALFFGSLTGVLIKRIPEDKNFGFARSECPHCGYQLKWYENIPLISFVILLGKCSNCSGKISYFYPGIEIAFLLCAIPFINITARAFLLGDAVIVTFIDFLFSMSFIALALALGLIDQKYKELPHILTYSGILLGIFYVSLFGTHYYSASSSLANLLPSISALLLPAFSAIKQFAIVVFSLDILVFFANLIIFRENALLDASSALSFGQKKLQENMKLVYLVYLVLILTLIYLGQSFVLELFFVGVGLLYLFFEILPYLREIATLEKDTAKNADAFSSRYSRSHDASHLTEGSGTQLNTLSSEDLGNHNDDVSSSVTESLHHDSLKTIFGGGDIMFLGFFATILGYQQTAFTLLTAFYIAFILLMIKIIYKYFDYQIKLRKTDAAELDNSFDIKSILRGNIPIGLALALSFIAVMIMLAK